MYSTINKLSIICIIAAVVNAICAVLIYMSQLNQGLDPNFLTALLAFLITTPVIFLLLSLALRNLYGTLTTQSDAQLEELTELKKRVEVLEKK